MEGPAGNRRPFFFAVHPVRAEGIYSGNEPSLELREKGIRSSSLWGGGGWGSRRIPDGPGAPWGSSPVPSFAVRVTP
jgi:hypothetical protein